MKFSSANSWSMTRFTRNVKSALPESNNVRHSRFRIVPGRGNLAEPHSWSGHGLHFGPKYRSRTPGWDCVRARNFARQYFSHLRRRARAFGNSRHVGPRLRDNQTSRWRVSGFPRNQNDPRSTEPVESPVQFSATHNDRRVSSGRFDEYSESESGALLSRVSSAVHRSGIEYENRRVHHARAHVCHDRHNLVSRSRLVCIDLLRTIKNQRNDCAVAQSNSRRAFCFPGSAPRHCEVTISMLSDDVLRTPRS